MVLHHSSLPQRAPARFGHIPDGAGLVSSALWPLLFKSDIFIDLRKLENIAISFGLTSLVPDHIQEKKMESPFSNAVIEATLETFC